MADNDLLHDLLDQIAAQAALLDGLLETGKQLPLKPRPALFVTMIVARH